MPNKTDLIVEGIDTLRKLLTYSLSKIFHPNKFILDIFSAIITGIKTFG